MPINTTKLADMVNPEVMADMISAKIPEMIVVTPFAKVDDTLKGRPGDTITVPSFKFIGAAEDVAEGVACGTTKLETSTETFTVKKVMKAVDLTDEAVLSGYGNPVGETNSQLAKAVAVKVDADVMDALKGAQMTYDGTAEAISYAGIVKAVDLFDEEVQSAKAIFVNPHQLTTLRLDDLFISADKYNNEVVLRGEIGMIAGARVVPSKRVVLDGDGVYNCPIVKLTNEAQAEDDAAAVTIFMKKDVGLEAARDTLARITVISVDEHYGVAITNQEKVVVARFAGE